LDENGSKYGYCANKVCAGGIRDSQDCTSPKTASGLVADPDKWCNSQEGNSATLEPKYLKALDTSVFMTQFNGEAASMPQCRDVNNLSGKSDNRPNQTTSFPKDFCWVQPRVHHIKVNGRYTGNVLLNNGGGTVALQFNSSVDIEQAPIRGINIDWGDDTPVTSMIFTKGTGLNPKDLVADPHDPILHDYNKVNGANPSYKIRVWIQDNWGRGSGYCAGTTTQCSSDAECVLVKCEGVCRSTTGGANEFKNCNATNYLTQCGGDPGYCSSVFQGDVTVIPNP
jgi:hypothetical protein